MKIYFPKEILKLPFNLFYPQFIYFTPYIKYAYKKTYMEK